MISDEIVSPRNKDTAARQFINKLYTTFPVNPLDNSEVILYHTSQKIALFELRPSQEGDDYVHISFMKAFPMRGGAGTAGMKKLQELAREAKINLDLVVWTKGSVKPEALKKFYTKMGFQQKRDKMIWKHDSLTEYKTINPDLRRTIGKGKDTKSGIDSIVVINSDNVVKHAVGMPEESTYRAAYGVLTFLRFIRQNPDNPSLPKIQDVQVKTLGKDRTLIVTMEKLLPLTRDDFYYWLEGAYLRSFIKRRLSWNEVKEEARNLNDTVLAYQFSRLSAEELEKLGIMYETVVKLSDYGKRKNAINTRFKLALDLHIDNVMKRSNGDYVLVDPFVA